MIEIIPNWHPILVHFTVALLLTATVLFVAAHLASNPSTALSLTTAARWNLWIGVGLTVITVATGWNAFNTVEHDDPAHEVMVDHRNLAFTTFGLFLLLAAWSFLRYREGQQRKWIFVILMLVGSGLLAATAWHGGELVYRHGLGVMSLPDTSGEGHAHENGHDHDHEPGIDTQPQPMGEEPAAQAMPPAETEEQGAETPHEHDHDDGHEH